MAPMEAFESPPNPDGRSLPSGDRSSLHDVVTGTDGRAVPHNDGQMIATLREIHDLVSDSSGRFPRVPDLELIINADDYGRAMLRALMLSSAQSNFQFLSVE